MGVTETMARKVFEGCLDHLNLLDENTDLSILNFVMDEYNLKPEQLGSVKESFLTDTGSAIESVETGLGKTVISLGLLQMLAPELQDKLVIITAPTNTITNFYRDVTNNTNFNVMMSSGKYAEVTSAIKSIEQGHINCLIVLPSAWTLSVEFNLFVFNNRERIKCFIWDECKGDEDFGFNHFIEAGHNADFVYPLNATVTGKGIGLLYKMLYVCSATELTERQFKRKYGHYTMTKEGNKIYHIHWDDIKREYGSYLVNFNREDVGAKTTYSKVQFHTCEVSSYQESIMEKTVARNILYAPVDVTGKVNPSISPMVIPSIANLVQIVAKYPSDDNILIYCRNIEPANSLFNLLSGMGYKVFRIDGNTTTLPELKNEAETNYNSAKGAIMITSIEEGSNLNSTKHVVIFQNPSDVMQYIARAARGFEAKDLTLDWIYYPKYEKESFIKNIESAIDVSIGAERHVEVLHIMMNEAKKMYPEDERLQIFENNIIKYNL